jgi:cytoskeletal protein CcmA (bactofilin family)
MGGNHGKGKMTFFSGRRSPKSDLDEPEHEPAPAPVPRQPVGFETVLGPNCVLSGELRSQANVRLDGTFEGTLEIDGNILVGETAKINADIHAKNISVAGAVRGNISGNKVQLLRTARVWGNISASAITTEEGAFIDGKLTMVRHDASTENIEIASLPAPEPPPTQPEEELEVVIGETLPEDEAR